MIQEKQNQKKVNYSVMSDKLCKICGAPIKQNVIQRNPQAVFCYVCFKVSQGKTISIQHRVINGEKIEIKRIDFKKLQSQNISLYKK